MTERATVFFDGSCPLCRREIAFYRRLRGAETICWQDVSQNDDQSVAPGLTRSAALARFHVMLGDGRLVSGGDAFRAVWRRLPLFRPAALLLSLPGLRWVLNRAYDGFLKVRPVLQRRMADCAEATPIDGRSTP